MVSLDRKRRIRIVRGLTVTFIGLAVAYLLPEILGLILKLSSGDESATRPWVIAMNSLPIRIVHIAGLVIAGIALIATFRNWALRFIAERPGD